MVALMLWVGCGDSGDSYADRADRLDAIATVPLPFTAGTGIEWLGDRSVAVLDTDDPRVVEVDLEMGLLGQGGREGAGPGELKTPTDVLAGDSSILVADANNLRVTEFDRQLNAVRVAPIPGFPLGLVSGGSDSVTVAWVDWGEAQSPVLGQLSMESGDVDVLFVVFDAVPALRHVRGEAGASPFVAVSPGPNGHLIVGHGDVYELFELDRTGREVRRFGRPEIPAEYPSEADLERIRSGLRRITGSVDESVVAEFADRPKPFFSASALAPTASGGTLVVTSRGSRDSTFVDRFNADGQFLGSWVLRDRVTAVAARGGRLAALLVRSSGPREGLHAIDFYDLDAARRPGSSREAPE